VVQSHFELNIFEILNLSRSDHLVVNWLTALEAASGVEPTVLVEFRIVLHFDKHADLCHDLVTEAKVAALNVNTFVAHLVSLRLLLLPNVEIDTMRRVVFLPL